MTNQYHDPKIIAALINKCPITLEMSARRVQAWNTEGASDEEPLRVCNRWKDALDDGSNFTPYMERHSRDVADWVLQALRMLEDTHHMGDSKSPLALIKT